MNWRTCRTCGASSPIPTISWRPRRCSATTPRICGRSPTPGACGTRPATGGGFSAGHSPFRTNLIVNAAHAIADAAADRPGAAQGTITVETALNQGFAEIRISDSGEGIPDAIKDRLFEPFFTTKEVGRGTGQGLALVRSMIVDRHGGSITFTSELGKGSTFTVAIPVDSSPLP